MNTGIRRPMTENRNSNFPSDYLFSISSLRSLVSCLRSPFAVPHLSLLAILYALRTLHPHSYLSDSTGLVIAALIACELTVNKAMNNANPPANKNTEKPIFIRNANVCNQ